MNREQAARLVSGKLCDHLGTVHLDEFFTVGETGKFSEADWDRLSDAFSDIRARLRRAATGK